VANKNGGSGNFDYLLSMFLCNTQKGNGLHMVFSPNPIFS
jgi:hypothetical protein